MPAAKGARYLYDIVAELLRWLETANISGKLLISREFNIRIDAKNVYVLREHIYGINSKPLRELAIS